MATIIMLEAPIIGVSEVTASYKIDRGEKGTTELSVVGNVTPDNLPLHKRDALNLASIWDACSEFIAQVTRTTFAAYNAEVRSYNQLKADALMAGDAGLLLSLVQNPPVKPDMPDNVAAEIAPYVRFLDMAKAAWQGARKHTLSVHGSGKNAGIVVWTGTLSSLTRARPARGVIAKGRQVV